MTEKLKINVTNMFWSQDSKIEKCPRCNHEGYKESKTILTYPCRECTKCGATYSLIDNDRFTLDKSTGGNFRVASC